MKAYCLDCQNMVEADEELVRESIRGPETCCQDVAPENCRGDDLHADDDYNDPRTGQAAAINAANRSRR